VADVFISYAREDSQAARQLAYAFEREDWSCWWDPQIALGDDFRPVVAGEIDAAAAVVVVWSPAARTSSWVRWEVERAQAAGKLVELDLVAVDEERLEVPGGALAISGPAYLPPLRDRVLARVAEAGNLHRRCDGWNSRVRATAWRSRPPKRPIIAWEVVDPGTEALRIVRRERWADAASVDYGTTIGNAWLFGHEGKRVAIGWLTVTDAEHDVQLPKPDRSAERRDYPFTSPFTFEVNMAEMLEGLALPGGGVDLAVRT
jgi:TIR domain